MEIAVVIATSVGEFLTPVVVLAAIGFVLAAVLVVSEYYLANYAECRLNVNDDEGKSFVTAGGKDLLKILQDHDIFIPSACGGKATCGYCKLEVPNGGPPLPTELPMLTRDEIRRNVRLTCQLKVKNDLDVKIPAQFLDIRQFNCVVERNDDVTHNIKELVLALKKPDRMTFKPGQYVQFSVPLGNGTSEERAYSAASTSEEIEQGRVILNVRWGFGGVVSTRMAQLKPGDEVTISGPYGEFGIHDTDAEMICVAGGAGMAPLRAIILEMARRQSKRKIVYFFGGRLRKDLFYLDTWAELEKSMHDFTFVPALSDVGDDDKDWTGERGMVHLAVERYLNERCESDPEKIEGYLCGPPPMIDCVIEVMTAFGVPPEKVYFDKF